ncbi:superoxide dismutase [Flavobacterium silvaticum]|uniref:Superoxide dismutase n=1 Tax=Flavobacterium silvaticum TaxID=1852020 RepID=A0A972JHC9_9FLAO|nr:superoxide dismutase [Flavobacterium silvaticum]NMH26998.1 superoxide dismutase [Flavobacterium silvaticum]
MTFLKHNFIPALIIASGLLFSCQKKKLTEVVEVPLPTAEEKVTIGHPDEAVADPGAFEMYKLPFEYDELAPNIDAMTMEMHFSKHYLTYTNNLNRLLDSTELAKLPIEEIFKKLDMSNADLRNNLGGYYNHTLYWETIAPKKGGEPKDNALAAAISKDFGSFANFKESFENAASRQFGSGWAWLVVDRSGNLQVTSTPNQDNPLMPQATIPGKPILGIDVWEHAYYLGYQYKRKKYIDAFFNVINWDKVSEKYDDAVRK